MTHYIKYLMSYSNKIFLHINPKSSFRHALRAGLYEENKVIHNVFSINQLPPLADEVKKLEK